MCWETAYEQWLNAPGPVPTGTGRAEGHSEGQDGTARAFLRPFGFRYRRTSRDDESGSTPYECPCCPVGDPGIWPR